MKWILLFLALTGWTTPLWTQTDSLRMEKGEPQFGVRAGYALELPSTNYYRGQEFTLFEAGHRFSFGAWLNLPIDWNVQFAPYFGIDNNVWPKSTGYSGDCTQDSFPTFLATDDSVPGRNFRVNNLVFEPGFKFFVPRLLIYLKFQAHLTYAIRTRYENYPFSCGVQGQQNFQVYEENELRTHNRFNFGLGGGIVKEVRLGNGTGIALEPGFKVMLTPLLTVRDEDREGPYFSLYPWGFYLNIGVFR